MECAEGWPDLLWSKQHESVEDMEELAEIVPIRNDLLRHLKRMAAVRPNATDPLPPTAFRSVIDKQTPAQSRLELGPSWVLVLSNSLEITLKKDRLP